MITKVTLDNPGIIEVGTDSVEIPIKDDTILPETKTVKGPRSRKRIPIHKQNMFNYEELGLNKEVYVYRFVNSFPAGNIERYERAGYEHCHDKSQKPIRRRAGKNEEGSQYLMRIPKDLYLADQKDKQKAIDELEADMGIKQAASRGLAPQYAYNPTKR